jgi:D-3-phosphoglycerate dehydrogenase / 2-oxoglutarate reductase
MKILVGGDSYCPWRALGPSIDRLAESHDVTCFDVVDEPGWRPTTPSELKIKEWLGSPRQVIERLDGHDVLVVQGAPVTDAVMDACPSLKLVCVARGGPVNVDIAAATERGIAVVTTPGKNAQAVAELTIAFMVMLARRLPEVVRFLEGGGELARDNYEGAKWMGHDLDGHVLGLVGYGQIGHRVARIAMAMGMRVIASDPFVPAARIEADGCEPVDLETLLATADYVSIHARATADNRGMIGRAQIEQMKQGACLINTARDTLVDEDAVYDALRSGHLGGVGFDVVRIPDLSIPPELGRRHRLFDSPNVVIATHIGGATYETMGHGGETAAAEIGRLAAGQPFANLANPAVLEKVGNHA